MKPKPRTRTNIQPKEASLGNLFMRSIRNAVARMEPISRTTYLVTSLATCAPSGHGFHHRLIKMQRARPALPSRARVSRHEGHAPLHRECEPPGGGNPGGLA